MGFAAMNQYMHVLIALVLVQLTHMMGLEKYLYSEATSKLLREQLPVRFAALFIIFAIAFYVVRSWP